MPPLSLTHSNTALAMFGISVKSVPGCLVAMPPSLIGVPVAFWPLPAPHLGAPAGCADGLVLVPPPPPPVLLAQPASAIVIADTRASAAIRLFLLTALSSLSQII